MRASCDRGSGLQARRQDRRSAGQPEKGLRELLRPIVASAAQDLRLPGIEPRLTRYPSNFISCSRSRPSCVFSTSLAVGVDPGRRSRSDPLLGGGGLVRGARSVIFDHISEVRSAASLRYPQVVHRDTHNRLAVGRVVVVLVAAQHIGLRADQSKPPIRLGMRS